MNGLIDDQSDGSLHHLSELSTPVFFVSWDNKLLMNLMHGVVE